MINKNVIYYSTDDFQVNILKIVYSFHMTNELGQNMTAKGKGKTFF